LGPLCQHREVHPVGCVAGWLQSRLDAAKAARYARAMTLEDHVGDVIRKARLMTGVAPETAAAAAGLTPDELAALEDSGRVEKHLNFAALAALLGLQAGKLEGLANGWLPAEIDLSQWRELRRITTAGEGMTVNCYLVWDEVTRDAALFDTGWEATPIFDLLEHNQLQLRHLFITHTHRDHIAAIAPIRERFPKVKLHSSAKGAPVDQRNRPNDCIQLGSLRITHRDTPGHAEDGVTYLVGTWPEDAPHVAMVGDAIFAGSMGGAKDFGELAKSKIREQILTLPPATLICPGHGPVTTVAEQKAHNPFF
jgi:glyoxylase-like metal-dependent hydrolase (beta-lactamase superfamily II)